VFQELGGWSGTEMVKRYAHLTAGLLLKYAENITEPQDWHKTPLKII